MCIGLPCLVAIFRVYRCHVFEFQPTSCMKRSWSHIFWQDYEDFLIHLLYQVHILCKTLNIIDKHGVASYLEKDLLFPCEGLSPLFDVQTPESLANQCCLTIS